MAAKDCIGPQCDAFKNPMSVQGDYKLGFGVSEPLTHEVGKMYHGTGGGLTGGVVKPATERTVYGESAYAEVGTDKADSLKTARSLARGAAQKQGTLFGTIYEVEPMSQADVFKSDETVGHDWRGQTWAKDNKGLRATKAVGFPINPDVWESSQAKADSDAAYLKANNNSVV